MDKIDCRFNGHGVVSLKVGVVKQKFLRLFAHRIIRTPILYFIPSTTTATGEMKWVIVIVATVIAGILTIVGVQWKKGKIW